MECKDVKTSNFLNPQFNFIQHYITQKKIKSRRRFPGNSCHHKIQPYFVFVTNCQIKHTKIQFGFVFCNNFNKHYLKCYFMFVVLKSFCISSCKGKFLTFRRRSISTTDNFPQSLNHQAALNVKVTLLARFRSTMSSQVGIYKRKQEKKQ